jgi:hypothetical protein
MSDISIQTGLHTSKRLAQSLMGFRAHIKDLEREMLKQEAALAARAFIKFSPPIPMGGGMGDKMPAKKQGMIAVERDIRSIFAPLNATLSSALDPTYGGMQAFMEWRSKKLRGGKASAVLHAIHQDPVPERAFNKANNLYKNGGRHVSRGFVISETSLLSKKHKDQRKTYRGRITRHRGPDQYIQRHPYFAEPLKLDRYIASQQARVGHLQSGWLKVILAIGQVRIRGIMANSAQKGLLKHLYTLSGSGEVRYSSNFYSKFTGMSPAEVITIRNPSGNINGVGDDSQTKMKVIQYRQNQLLSRPYARLMSKSIRDWNSGRNPTL